MTRGIILLLNIFLYSNGQEPSGDKVKGISNSRVTLEFKTNIIFSLTMGWTWFKRTDKVMYYMLILWNIFWWTPN